MTPEQRRALQSEARERGHALPAGRSDVEQLVEDGHFGALVDAAFPGVVAARHESDQGLLAVWRDMAAAVGPDVFLRQQRAVMGRPDSRDLLPSITCPTTVIHGAEDRLIPIKMARELTEEIPDAELVVIDRAGHFTFSEQPASGASAVTHFLSRAC